MNEVEQAFGKYLEKLDRLVIQVKLVAFHAKEAAECANRTANLAKLTSFRISEYLKRVKK